jgi:hypothetical protein
MPIRPNPDTIKSLCATLLRLEQALDPSYNEADLAELKRVILKRIAELEIALASSVQEKPATPARTTPLIKDHR